MSFFETLANINSAINDFVWVQIGLVILIGTGILMTVLTGFFQVSHIGHWWKKTIGGMFKKDSLKKKDEKSVSQFQALCTALAATIGTGNIAGVATAIVIGGPGAVFWMWIAAFLGMMTNFSENVLGIYYRRRNKQGEWSGGPMYYLRDGLGKATGYEKIGKVLAVLFSLFAILASFGIGNMGQVNKITLNIKSAFFANVEPVIVFGNVELIPLIIGISLVILGGLIILGGLQRIAAVAEKVVPFMAIAYIVGALIVCCANITQIGPAFLAIFKFAFGIKAVGGAAVGIAIKEVITQGCKRGVFSNEAGLGSSVMVHSNSDVVEPVKQGMWGIFEVFVDTLIVCTITALTILTSGVYDYTEYAKYIGTNLPEHLASGVALTSLAFESVFGSFGSRFISIAIMLFAFTTILGWSYYGERAVEYLLGLKAVFMYKIIFILVIFLGCNASLSLVVELSDTFNGFMALPNLIAITLLSGEVVKMTKDYLSKMKKDN